MAKSTGLFARRSQTLVRRATSITATALVVLQPGLSFAQPQPGLQSRNVELVARHPLGGLRSTDAPAENGFEALGRRISDVVMEQEPDRPFVWVTRRHTPSGVTAVDISRESAPQTVYSWTLDNGNSSEGAGATDVTYLRSGNSVHLVVGVQSEGDSDETDLGAVVLDVSRVASGQVSEAARLSSPGGYHHLFAYKHSAASRLLFATGGGALDVYDFDAVLGGSTQPVYSFELPEEVPNVDYGFHRMEAAYHFQSESDRLYAGGAGGFYVYDITDPLAPELLTSIASAAVQIGNAVAPTPDGNLLVTSATYRASPLRLFDLTPAFGENPVRVRTATGAWVADWRNRTESVAVRWPFVFAAATDDGFHAVNIRNPIEPYTAGYFHTWTGESAPVSDPATDRTGAWDVDVRNRDGLIAVTDVNTGLWLFRMDAFFGWDGRGWGLPDISAVQNWADGPLAAMEWPADPEAGE